MGTNSRTDITNAAAARNAASQVEKLFAQPQQPSACVGQILNGRYAITGEVGLDALGMVYSAEDTQSRAQLWVRALPQVLESDGQATMLIQAAVIRLRSLRHDAIIRIVDAFESAGARFIVSEAIQGQTLEQILNRRG